MTPASPEVARQVPFGPGWHHFGSGFNEPNGDHLCMSRRVTCVAGKGRLPPVAGHMTPAEQEVEPGHVSPTEPEVGAGHLTPAEPEVARTAPSWIPARAILARGLMSLMETTCIGLGGSRVWQGRVTCPLGRVT